MLGLGNFKDYEDCIEFIKEHDSFNSILQVSLYVGSHPIKMFFAVDRFQSLFLEDGYSTTDLESIFYDEPYEHIQLQYKLLPTKKRNYPVMCSSEMSKEQVLKIKDFNVHIAKQMLNAIRSEILNALIEGD